MVPIATIEWLIPLPKIGRPCTRAELRVGVEGKQTESTRLKAKAAKNLERVHQAKFLIDLCKKFIYVF